MVNVIDLYPRLASLLPPGVGLTGLELRTSRPLADPSPPYATVGSSPPEVASRVPGRSCSAAHTHAPRLGQALRTATRLRVSTRARARSATRVGLTFETVGVESQAHPILTLSRTLTLTQTVTQTKPKPVTQTQTQTQTRTPDRNPSPNPNPSAGTARPRPDQPTTSALAAAPLPRRQRGRRRRRVRRLLRRGLPRRRAARHPAEPGVHN